MQQAYLSGQRPARIAGETERIQVGKVQTLNSPAIAGTCRGIRVPELMEL
jgi:hypothetical protein